VADVGSITGVPEVENFSILFPEDFTRHLPDASFSVHSMSVVDANHWQQRTKLREDWKRKFHGGFMDAQPWQQRNK
jgi:hypothetical protein